MTRSEMIEKAKMIRSRDRFGTMAQEELDALPGTETLLQIPVDGGKRVPVYEIRPDTPLENPAPLLLNFHGGGFLKGRGDRDKRYCCHMAQQLGCLVWDVDYSLAPEAPFPTALNESYAVTAYAFAHAEELGIDPQRIALAGHSAGGNLVAAMLIRAYREQSFRPLAALMEYFPADQTVDPADKLSPELRQNPWWLQRAATEKEYTLYYCSPEQAEDPLCSPMLASDEELASFPDSLVISAGKDSLQQETESFAHRLMSLGVPVTGYRIPEAVHGFTTNRTEGWEKALALHCKFFQSHYNGL